MPHSAPAIDSLPLLALYAEVHFRFFRLFPSYLFSRRPEVIFDAPKRLDPGQDLPIVLVVNDVHRFPAALDNCAVAVSCANARALRFDFSELDRHEIDHPLRRSLRVFLLTIPRAQLPAGWVSLTCRVDLTCKGKHSTVINDNLRTTSKRPYSCYLSDEKLPGAAFCSYGDLHVHSHYSQSHVEFGTPLAIIRAIAKASGLAFAGITDHSYDLACSMEDYLTPDPNRPRWRSLLAEAAAASGEEPFLIPGEEISCLNGKGEVVHLGALNLRDYIGGTLDGARKGRKNEEQPKLADALTLIHEQGGMAFAAHPAVRMGTMQRLFLYRGEWTDADYLQPLDALQIVNNGYSASWERGKRQWLSMLRRGIKVPIIAGNDAHGDFNRYRAIRVPFIAIAENQARFMGFGKTGIYGKPTSIPELLGRLKAGATFVTTGPFLALGPFATPSDFANSNSTIPRRSATISVLAGSSSEFGPLVRVAVYGGGRESAQERLIFARTGQKGAAQWNVRAEIAIPPGIDYLRAEAECAAVGSTLPARAYTSAVFLEG